MIYQVDKDYSLYRLSKLSTLMECVLQVVLIQAPPSLGQTENCVEKLQILADTNSMPGVHDSYVNTHSGNVLRLALYLY